MQGKESKVTNQRRKHNEIRARPTNLHAYIINPYVLIADKSVLAFIMVNKWQLKKEMERQKMVPLIV